MAQGLTVEARQLEDLRRLNEVWGLVHLPLIEQQHHALQVIAEHLGLEFGIISRIVPDEDLYEVVAQASPPDTLHDGQRFLFGESYCNLTLGQQEVLAISHMATSRFSHHPCFEKFKLQAYIGAPVIVRGQLYGTVNFSSPFPYQRDFDETDKEFLRLLARWVGAAIERDMDDQQLRDSLQMNLLLLHNASDGIHILDEQANIIEVSESFCEMLGYRREELIGMNVLQWDAQFSPEQALALVRQQFDQPRRHVFETAHRRKDGTLIDVEVTGNVVAIAGRRVLFNAARDITTRKQAEKALQESEARFREFFEANSVVMLLIDPASGKIIDANRAALRYYGYPQAQLLGLAIQDINTLPPEEVRRQRELAIAKRLNVFHFKHRLASGEVRDVDVFSTPFNRDGQQRLFSIVIDVADRQQTA